MMHEAVSINAACRKLQVARTKSRQSPSGRWLDLVLVQSASKEPMRILDADVSEVLAPTRTPCVDLPEDAATNDNLCTPEADLQNVDMDVATRSRNSALR